MSSAKVYGLEFGTNILTKENVRKYFNLFVDSRYYVKSILHDNSEIIYENAYRVLSLYDKYSELQSAKYNIPKQIKPEHLLRYEVRIKKRLASYFKVPTVMVSSLYDIDYYTGMLKLWYNEYISIKKMNDMKHLNSTMLKSTSNINKYYAAEGIRTKGIFNVLTEIDGAKEELTTSQFYKAKRRIKDLAYNKNCTVENDLIKELDRKMLEIVEYQLSA